MDGNMLTLVIPSVTTLNTTEKSLTCLPNLCEDFHGHISQPPTTLTILTSTLTTHSLSIGGTAVS